MSFQDPQYDVAISFLSADESLAAGINDKLAEQLDVFFYPREQETLAGTNGLESMRLPFAEDSRIVVVLFRDPWGETEWTRIESTAIQEGCLKHGWSRLFFMMLDEESAPPIWLPRTHIRFNYTLFGVEQAVGAIKARVLESGGRAAPVSAVKRAELARRETEYVVEKERLQSYHRREKVGEMTAELFQAVEALCAEVTATGNAAIQFAMDVDQCHLRDQHVSLLVTKTDWSSNPGLAIRGFNKRLAFKGERLFYMNGDPKKITEKRFLPDLNRAGAFGWCDKALPETFLTSAKAADNIVSAFIALSAGAERRKA